MVKVGGLTYESNVNFGQKTISIIIPNETTDNDISVLKAATTLEIMSNGETVGTYKLNGWLREEKLWNGILFTWQTISQDEVEVLTERVTALQADLTSTNTDLANLTETVQELAEAIEEGDYAEAQALLDILLGEGTSDESEPEVGDGE